MLVYTIYQVSIQQFVSDASAMLYIRCFASNEVPAGGFIGKYTTLMPYSRMLCLYSNL
jgi:hypothetical protein